MLDDNNAGRADFFLTMKTETTAFRQKQNPPAIARAAGFNEMVKKLFAHLRLSFAGLAATYSSAS